MEYKVNYRFFYYLQINGIVILLEQLRKEFSEEWYLILIVVVFNFVWEDYDSGGWKR